jgi:inosose dehydratase
MSPKIAGAPISWGVCEAENWGHQMGSDRVFTEMASLGLTGTEFGPAGFLPEEPAARAKKLKNLGMQAIGGFFPVVLHDPGYDPLPKVTAELDAYEAAGADVLVIAAEQLGGSYDHKRPEISESAWQVLLENLNRIDDFAKSRNILATVHPHVGTMLETEADIHHVLGGTQIGFTLDTGHMFIGGTDPVNFSKEFASRVKHTHLKDVRLELAQKVKSGELTYYQAVVNGMYVPLGEGDIDIRSIVKNLLDVNYSGWFCLEQDNVVATEPASGEGPIDGARRSVEYIGKIFAELGA